MSSKTIPYLVEDFAALELSESLEALRPFLPVLGARYQKADWLLCSFTDAVWKIKLEHYFEIDWRVPIGSSGELLTDPNHASLLEVLRSWVIVQTHPDLTGRALYSPDTGYNSIRRVVALIDYLLIHADRLNLLKYGLRGMSADDWKALLGALSAHAGNIIAIYEWPTRVTQYLREAAKTVTDTERSSILKEQPFLSENIPHEEYRMTDLNEHEIIGARIALWKNEAYVKGDSSDGFGYRANTSLIIRTLYSGTLAGCNTKVSMPPEIGLLPGYGVRREKRAIRVTSDYDDRRSARELRWYIKCIGSLRLLNSEGLAVPRLDHDSLRNMNQVLDVKAEGRFKTVPYDVVMKSTCAAITFALNHGDDLVKSYLAIAREAAKMGISVSSFDAKNDIRPFLTENARKMGVKKWTIETSGFRASGSFALTADEYYARLRANYGLFECLRVLYGASQIVIGVLMARRGGELADLVAGKSLDTTKKHLVFSNRKSGIADIREVEARPIPALGVELIELIEQIQYGLIDLGMLKTPAPLFAPPKVSGDEPLFTFFGHIQYNDSLDFFCDYVETPVDSNGCRYYLRQHQLRRWFAMLFFWGNSFGGIDTLRWFLGHTDMQMLYNYITESIPGEALRTIAATWACYGLKQAAPETEALSAIVEEHFGTRNFEVMEDEKLGLYLEELIESGRLVVEPEFLDEGRTCRICVKLTPCEMEDA